MKPPGCSSSWCCILWRAQFVLFSFSSARTWIMRSGTGTFQSHHRAASPGFSFGSISQRREGTAVRIWTHFSYENGHACQQKHEYLPLEMSVQAYLIPSCICTYQLPDRSLDFWSRISLDEVLGLAPSNAYWGHYQKKMYGSCQRLHHQHWSWALLWKYIAFSAQLQRAHCSPKTLESLTSSKRQVLHLGEHALWLWCISCACLAEVRAQRHHLVQNRMIWSDWSLQDHFWACW